MKHHPFSPSCLGRRLLCPGSWRMEMAAGERESDDAARGTRLHDEMARCRGDWKTTDEEEVALLERCWRRIDADIGTSVDAYVIREIYGPLKGTGDDPVTGTADCLAYIPGEKTAYLYDWKFGRGDAPTTFLTLQQAVYAAMLFQAKTNAERFLGTPTCYEFIEARAYYPESDQAFETTIRASDVPGIVRTVEAIIAACEDPKAPLRPGPEQCKYCRAAAGCPGLATQIELVVSEPMSVTPEKRARRRDARAMIEKWTSAVQDDDKAFLASGGEIPGWRMSARAGREYVADPLAVVRAVGDDLGEMGMWQCLRLDLTTLKDVWNKRHGGERKDTDAALLAKIAPYVTRSAGFEALIRASK
jgi:hypothetical protein